MQTNIKKTFEDVYSIFEKDGYYILSDENSYKNRLTKLNVRDSEDYLYFMSYSVFHSCRKKNNYPERFNFDNPHSGKNINNWLNKNNKKIKLISKYLGAKNKDSVFLCLVCKNEFKCQWSNIFQNRGCPFCSGKYFLSENSFGGKYKEMLIDWDYSKNKKSPYEYSYGSGKNVFWICHKCKHSWKSSIHSRTSLKRNCPKCASSKGEKEICDFLKENKIEFILHRGIRGCKNIKLLPFDFYLPKYNLYIEYQGIQHYFVVDFAGRGIEWAKNNFIEIKKRDRIKKSFCKKNNIPLLIISYREFDQIDSILERSLQ